MPQNASQIVITPIPKYLPEHSSPDDGRYVFAYTITIENRGQTPVQLIARHWFITDERGNVHEVQGLGVVGEQPVLQPGASYQYTSGSPLPTPIGTMRGYYRMVDAGGESFEAEIPEFVLAAPGKLH